MLYSKLAGFLVLLGFLLQRAAAEDHGEGCKLAGTYVFDSEPDDPKIEAFLTAIGYSHEDIQMIQSFAKGLKKEISYKDGVMTVKTITAVKTQENSFESGKQFTEQPLVGVPLQTIATIEKSKLTLVRKTPAPASLETTEVLTCTDEGCTAALSIKGKDAAAQIKWKRVEAEKSTIPPA